MIPAAIDACREDLFTSEEELNKKYPPQTVQRVLRIREMYNWFIANPDSTDKEFVSEVVSRHKISRVKAYGDLEICKVLLPAISQSSRDFHRWRYNEMILATYKMAEKRQDTKTMEKAATSYAKLNRVDVEDAQSMPFELIVPQPFTATEDPRVLGIDPLPNLHEHIKELIDKYSKETMDIEDISFEEVDLELDTLTPQPGGDEKNSQSL